MYFSECRCDGGVKYLSQTTSLAKNIGTRVQQHRMGADFFSHLLNILGKSILSRFRSSKHVLNEDWIGDNVFRHYSKTIFSLQIIKCAKKLGFAFFFKNKQKYENSVTSKEALRTGNSLCMRSCNSLWKKNKIWSGKIFFWCTSKPFFFWFDSKLNFFLIWLETEIFITNILCFVPNYCFDPKFFESKFENVSGFRLGIY